MEGPTDESRLDAHADHLGRQARRALAEGRPGAAILLARRCLVVRQVAAASAPEGSATPRS